MSGRSNIVNISSTEGHGATPGISLCTMSKHGVIGLTRALSVELGAKDVTVNCACPGAIHTGITAAAYINGVVLLVDGGLVSKNI